MRLTVLSQFLQFLELLETVADFVAFLWAPVGLSVLVCGISYGMLLLGNCDVPTAAILASAIAMTVYSVTQQPDA